MAAWIEVVIAAPPGYVDELAGILATEVTAAAAGLEIRESSVAFWVPDGEQDAARAETASVLARLADAGAPVSGSTIEAREAPPEKEWREAYKRYFRVARLTRQLVVVPSWESFAPEPDDRVVHLDPGQAFGTGSHATTTLVLGEIQRLADSGATPLSCLDIGTGSGILTIAVGRLLATATRLCAFDNDPLASSAAAENCARNGIDADVSRRDSPMGLRGEAGFDLILANIQRHVLLELADDITGVAGAGATCLLSGLLAHQLDEISSAYRARGWIERRRQLATDDSEWGVLVLSRGPGSPGGD